MKSTIWGHVVSYEDNVVHDGMYFLSRQLSAAEAKVFFDEAYNYGSAVFQDHMGYKFKLVHKDGEYELVKP